MTVTVAVRHRVLLWYWGWGWGTRLDMLRHTILAVVLACVAASTLAAYTADECRALRYDPDVVLCSTCDRMAEALENDVTGMVGDCKACCVGAAADAGADAAYIRAKVKVCS